MTSGELRETITSENLTEVFGLPITVTEEDGRYTARAA